MFVPTARQLSVRSLRLLSAELNTSSKRTKTYHLVVVGGGSGGISVASKFKNLNRSQLAVVEPADVSRDWGYYLADRESDCWSPAIWLNKRNDRTYPNKVTNPNKLLSCTATLLSAAVHAGRRRPKEAEPDVQVDERRDTVECELASERSGTV